jgi:hypothetical protein
MRDQRLTARAAEQSAYRSKPNSLATVGPDAGDGFDVGMGSAVGAGAGLGVTGSDGGVGAGDGR